MEIIVRPMEQADADALAEMRIQRGVMETTLGIPSFSRKNGESMADFMVNNTDTHAFVAEVEGKVVGSAGLGIARGVRRAHVASIGMSVHKDYQGKGIGTKLMEAMIDLADNWLMVLRIELEVFLDNDDAIRFYERFDFQREGIKRYDAVKNGEYCDILMMGRYRIPAQFK